MVFYTTSYQETKTLAIKVANAIKKGCFIAFNGDLGAGKTAFVTGLAQGLGSKEAVSSPTFALLNQYTDGRIPLYHFDLYRIRNTDELDGFGFEEYVENGLCIAEWSENLGDMLPENTVRVKIEKVGESERKITIEDLTPNN